jgi:Domain of unknown function (DUF4062)/Viral A-type inclusion protein repeat
LLEKRYQVFVSSTFEDLREERAAVTEALLELDCIPSGMELFPRGDDDQWALIRRVIDESDYYVVIIAGRYGSIGPGGKSFTQMEYEYAVSRGKPVMAFLRESPGKIPADKIDDDVTLRASLEQFRELVKTRLFKYWSSPKDLSGVVSRGIAYMKQNRPAVGWVRGDLVANERAIQEILRLRDRVSDLEQELAGAQGRPPHGVESLAQGDELISLTFRYSTISGRRETAFEFTWNELLSLLGPILLEEATESSFAGKLNEAFRNRARDERNVKASNVNIRNEDLQKVKLQLRALGIVTRSQDGLWQLTTYGDKLLMRNAAIRSQREA